MIEPATGKAQARLDILAYEVRQFFENISGRQTRRQEIENIRDANAHAAHTGTAAALLGIDGDSVEQLRHVACSFLRIHSVDRIDYRPKHDAWLSHMRRSLPRIDEDDPTYLVREVAEFERLQAILKRKQPDLEEEGGDA